MNHQKMLKWRHRFLMGKRFFFLIIISRNKSKDGGGSISHDNNSYLIVKVRKLEG